MKVFMDAKAANAGKGLQLHVTRQPGWLGQASGVDRSVLHKQIVSIEKQSSQGGRVELGGGYVRGGGVVVNGQGLCDKKERGRLFPSFVPKSLHYPE